MNTGAMWDGVVVGHIREVTGHPHADKLHICHVDVGSDVIQVVCGAPNVRAGQYVPVGLVGATLPNHLKIKKTTLRNVDSFGMICSEKELGLGQDHSGIMVLPGNSYQPGAPFEPPALNPVLDINVTPNRPDCLSHIGIARELSTILQTDLKLPDYSVDEAPPKAGSRISIRVVNPAACPRYSARIVENVKIGPSPEWLTTSLESVGIRSINNVVDITNYVMMESGQPLHAFDYDLIGGSEIIVRMAEKGERFQTLDGTEQILGPEDLLIADSRQGIALAGIMGGLNSEVTLHTRNVLIESAYFDPMTISRTARRLGLSTEASQRFSRGADPNHTVDALNRTAALMALHTGGRVLQGVPDVYPHPFEPKKIILRMERIQDILGVQIPVTSVKEILNRLELKVHGSDDLEVTVPTFRPDLEREIDLIEEVVRHHGYDKIPPKMVTTIPLSHQINQLDILVERIRDSLVGLGFLETFSNSLLSESDVSLVSRKHLSLLNPLSPETSCLRNSLLPGLLNVCRLNRNRSLSSLRFFEIGHIFIPQEKAKLPEESIILAGCMHGMSREIPFWSQADVPINFFHMKGVLEAFMSQLQLPDIRMQPAVSDFLEKGTAIEYYSQETCLGLMGKLNPVYAKRWDLKTDTYVFELRLEQILKSQPSGIRAESIPRFPAIRRDIALVMEDKITAGAVESVIRQQGGPLLESLHIFDVYRGSGIPAKKKSLAFSLTFRSKERTLKEEEIDPVMDAIITAVAERFSASLRS